MKQRNIVKVFLASPGDMAEERRAAKVIVERINLNWATWNDHQVELVGWEDTVSGLGRAQAVINKELDQCELFFGMIYQRWGTKPSSIGPYTSGFEEEFERSLKKFRETASPQMMLAFKEVSPEHLADPGEQLKKVIEFKDRIQEERSIYFESFKNIDEFKEKFERAISKYLRDIIDAYREKANDHGQGSSVPKAESGSGAQPTAGDFPPEAARFLSDFLGMAKSGSGGEITPLAVARLRLLSCVMSRSGNDDEFLGTHDGNIIFKNRASIVLSQKEISGLLKAGLMQLDTQTLPIWYWWNKSEVYRGDLSFLSIVGTDALRAHAIKAMRLVGELLDGEGHAFGRKDCLSTWFGAGSTSQVKVEALNYLAEMGGREDIVYIEEEINKGDYQTRGAASEAMLRIIARDNNEEAIRTLNVNQWDQVEEKTVRSIFFEANKDSRQDFKDSLLHRSAVVRLSAAEALVSGGELVKEQARSLLGDSDARVRVLALKYLEGIGEKYSLEEAQKIIVKYKPGRVLGILEVDSGSEEYDDYKNDRLRKMGVGELNILIEKNVFFPDDEYIARAYVDFESYGDDLRRQIEQGFRPLYDESYARLVEVAGVETARRFDGTAEFSRSQALRLALSVVEAKGLKSDLDLVRRAHKNFELKWRSSDAHFFSKHGRWDDIRLLADLVERGDYRSILGYVKSQEVRYSECAKVLIKIAGRRIKELLKEDFKDELKAAVVRQLPDVEIGKWSFETMLPLFASKTDSLRRNAVLKVVKSSSKKKLESVLARYIDGSRPWFYNVVHWLDAGISLPSATARSMAIGKLSP